MIKRILETVIQQKLWQGKALILFGARQVGKTTMLKNLLQAEWRLTGCEKLVCKCFIYYAQCYYRKKENHSDR